MQFEEQDRILMIDDLSDAELLTGTYDIKLTLDDFINLAEFVIEIVIKANSIKEDCIPEIIETPKFQQFNFTYGSKIDVDLPTYQ